MTKDDLEQLKSIVTGLDDAAAKVHDAGSRMHLDRALSELSGRVMNLRALATRLERKYHLRWSS